MRVLIVDAEVTGRDRVALARLVADAGVDLACIHGAPHLLRWRSACAALGRRSGLVVIGGGRQAGASLLLSTLAVDVLAARDVPLDGGLLRPPGASVALLRAGGRRVAFVGGTAPGNAAERVARAKVLRAAVREVAADAPVLLSVRGIERPGTAAWQVLAGDGYAGVGRDIVDRRITVDSVGTPDGYAGTGPAPTVLDIALPEP